MQIMKPIHSHKQRLIGWLLTFTLLILALPSDASWQCLNGTPCPQNCPLIGQSAPVSQPGVQPVAHCAKCHFAPTLAPPPGRETRCTSSPCILRIHTKPAASLSAKIIHFPPVLALPPPSTPISFFCSETAPVSFPLPFLFYPQRFLPPYVGRAPPVSL